MAGLWGGEIAPLTLAVIVGMMLVIGFLIYRRRTE